MELQDPTTRSLWIEEYLKEYSQHPISGQLMMGFLKKRYLVWNSIERPSELEANVCAKMDIYLQRKHLLSDNNQRESLLKEYTENYPMTIEIINSLPQVIENSLMTKEISAERHPALDQETISKLKDPNLWAIVRENLEFSTSIEYEGYNRGRTYRYKTSRPMFTAIDIARIIEQLLEKVECEMRWSEMYENVTQVLIQFHRLIERPEYDRQDQSEYFAARTYHDDKAITIQIDPHSYYQYQPNYEFETPLDDWAKNVYTKQWFVKSSTNVQRYFGIQGAKITRGSRRGTWIHQNHVYKIKPKSEGADLYKRLGDIKKAVDETTTAYPAHRDQILVIQALEREAQRLRSQISTSASSLEIVEGEAQKEP